MTILKRKIVKMDKSEKVKSEEGQRKHLKEDNSGKEQTEKGLF